MNKKIEDNFEVGCFMIIIFLLMSLILWSSRNMNKECEEKGGIMKHGICLDPSIIRN